ncbi:MAG: ATP-binding cassette domain-containing protein, partial [Pseudomonadota bacterium]
RLELRGVSARAGTLALKAVDLSLRAGEITGISGVSGNGQSVLADVLSGLVAPSAGAIRIDGREVAGWTPQEAVAAGLARIPEDRHGTGTIGDMSLAENAVSERYRDPAFSRMGVLDRGAARRFAERIVEDYEVKAPGPDAPIRLLSGGNMQKLILGRVLDGAPEVILANQPTRGLDIGAVAYVHGVLLEARARGAAILLISEDLDEVRALSDRIQVMSGGRLSAASPRGALGVVELGAMMAGVTDAA